MKKRILSVLLAAFMLISLLPMGALAADEVASGTCGDNLTWTLDSEGTLTMNSATVNYSHVHDYAEEEVIEPTCTENGYTDHTCICGDSYKTNEIAALGHNTELKNEKAATCTEAGYTGDKVCTVCNKTVKQGKTTAALSHKWDEGVITKKPTEKDSGIKTYTCTVCSATKTETIPPVEHIHSYTAKVTDPTCTKKGYTTHICSCGDRYAVSYVDALGHSYVNCVCTRCGTEYPFTDVDTAGRHKPFADTIQWAADEGITTGYGNGTFKPNTVCTRAHVVTFLYRDVT